MTRDEQRMVWRTYAAAALVALDVTKDGFGEICDVAEEMLNREMERFKGPDHSGDADTMVEPRPFAILTEADIAETRSGAAKASLWFDGSTTPRIQTEAQVEPRPWVSLTERERISVLEWYDRHASRTLDDLLIHHDEILLLKNGGTR